ncbi:MAG: zinc-ribbon domain-containing protein [Clostridia bacterium]|nr:zinc-ribbon domain-containing protein [Clostridia bacterium]
MSDMKKCPKCGAMLEENASFCFHCMTSLDKKQEIETGAPVFSKKKKIILAVILSIVLLSAVLVIFFGKSEGFINENKNGDYIDTVKERETSADSGFYIDGEDEKRTENGADKSGNGASKESGGKTSSGSTGSSKTSSSKSSSTGSGSSTSSKTTSSSDSKTSSASSSSTGSKTSSGSTASAVHTHSYSEATCQKPATCTGCGATSGSTVSHQYINGVCKWCGVINSSYYTISYSNPFTHTNVWDNQQQTINYSITNAYVSIANGTKDGNKLTFSYVVNSATAKCREVPFNIYYYDANGSLVDSAYRCSVSPLYNSVGSTGSFSNLVIPSTCKKIVISN